METQDKGSELPAKKVKTEVINMRVDVTTMRWLEELAEARGVGASTLARMFLLERLSKEPAPSWLDQG